MRSATEAAANIAVGVLTVLVVVAVLGYLGLVLRRYLLGRPGGVFDCSLRVRHDGGWTLGLARYGADRVDWYRTLSYSPRPGRVLRRGDLVLQRRRTPEPDEGPSLQPAQVIVEVNQGKCVFELALSEDALTGLLSWLEAAPPGGARRDLLDA